MRRGCHPDAVRTAVALLRYPARGGLLVTFVNADAVGTTMAVALARRGRQGISGGDATMGATEREMLTSRSPPEGHDLVVLRFLTGR